MSDKPKLMMLPAVKGACSVCAAVHHELFAHNAVSLFYLMRFEARYGRQPTWADAIAHLPELQQQRWIEAMRRVGRRYTEPPEGVAPIAEPYAVSGSYLGDI